MPVSPTYPGVYVEEIPSGVRTIVGVATSVTAFVGKAIRGPVNQAERVLNFSDFANKFGGLSASSEMSYAMQQFFLNGGSEAWVVRIAKGAVAAEVASGLLTATNVKVFAITAKYEGKVGNAISIVVDYKTRNPNSTFNLTVKYDPADNPSDAKTEKFSNLSMGKTDSRYAVGVINRESDLIQITESLDDSQRTDAVKTIAGKFESGELVDPTDKDKKPLDLANLVTNRSNQFQVQVNGLPAVTVTLDPKTDTKDGAALCAAVQKAVRGSQTQPALKGFQAEFKDNRIVMTSGEAGEDSRVEVLPGIFNDVFGKLK